MYQGSYNQPRNIPVVSLTSQQPYNQYQSKHEPKFEVNFSESESSQYSLDYKNAPNNYRNQKKVVQEDVGEGWGFQPQTRNQQNSHQNYQQIEHQSQMQPQNANFSKNKFQPETDTSHQQFPNQQQQTQFSQNYDINNNNINNFNQGQGILSDQYNNQNNQNNNNNNKFTDYNKHGQDYFQNQGHKKFENLDDVPNKPVQLIRVNNDGKFQFTQEAKDIIQLYQGNISFVGLAGKYRTGKSFLLNKLLNLQGRGFKVDPTTDACTQGIWMWSKPLVRQSDGLKIFFIDTEGSSSTDKDQRHDAKIFALTILLVNYFAFNSVGNIDELAMQQLQLTTTISKNIAVSQYGGKKDADAIAQYAPKFLWILRDFVLEIQDEFNREITPQQYLENALLNEHQSEKTKKVRQSLCEFFKDRDCITMIRPVEKESELQKLDQIPDNYIRQQFLQKVQEIKQKIFSKISPKTLNGIPLNPRMFVTMIESFVEKINEENGVPSIASAWESIVENECVQAKKEAETLYMEILGKNLTEDKVLNYNELFTVLRNGRDNAISQYENVAGIKEKNQSFSKYKQELSEFIEQKEAQLMQINDELAVNLCQEKLQNTFMEVNLNIHRNLYKMEKIEEFQEDFQNSLLTYNQDYQGPKKGESLSNFLKALERPLIKQLINTLDSMKGVDIDTMKEKRKFQQEKIQDLKSQYNLKENKKVQLQQKQKQLKKDLDKLFAEIKKAEKDTDRAQNEIEVLAEQNFAAKNQQLVRDLNQQKQQLQKLKQEYQLKIQKGYVPNKKKNLQQSRLGQNAF
ncbi:P-loop containing nucleoside triphosphate hydrolase [Pseudocohnilembus persalinus]|uniref:p-loop containing nucleoside triphosphate hydrolase n=1 Tax=Pseudocohnilembus persalinus TaxID=266149 RepID=A0A0V0R6B0_PSEPJ|nr:P-loop containing nucleoside triphosphate hydrolase [Pseudocohnilembus persalinus]|eukprot:KRX10023.1 P-loop containing nucleoside triphosphate hydrolase [Pseudocohnilembus persalinus]